MSPEVTFAIAGQWRSEALKGAALKLLQHPRLPFGWSFMQLAGLMKQNDNFKFRFIMVTIEKS